MSEDNNFYKSWRMPKSEQKKIKKEYESSKAAVEKINPDKFKDFKEMGGLVFDFFEELTGKKANRDIMIGNLGYYFDEGFIPDDMKNYIRDRREQEYFKNNPEMFTIAILFPIRDQDRINMAWDFLAHAQSSRTKGQKKMGGLKIRLPCMHVISVDKLRSQDGACLECPPPPSISEDMKVWVQSVNAKVAIEKSAEDKSLQNSPANDRYLRTS